MPITVFPNTSPAVKILETRVWTRVHIQVTDANTFYISSSRKLLESPGPNGLQQGLAITKLMGIVTLPWIGELWGIGSAAQTIVDIETLIPPGAVAGP